MGINIYDSLRLIKFIIQKTAKSKAAKAAFPVIGAPATAPSESPMVYIWNSQERLPTIRPEEKRRRLSMSAQSTLLTHLISFPIIISNVTFRTPFARIEVM